MVGKGGGLESGSASRILLVVVCVGASASPNSFVSTLRRVSFVK